MEFLTYLYFIISEGYKIWNSLSTESQEVLRPHLTSRYSCNFFLVLRHNYMAVYFSYSAVIPKGSSPKKPFFQSSKNVTFHYWIQHWCTFLIHKVSTIKNITITNTCIFFLGSWWSHKDYVSTLQFSFSGWFSNTSYPTGNCLGNEMC